MKLLRLCVAWAALISLSGCGDRKPEPNSAQGQADGPGVVDGAFFPHEGDTSSAAVAASAASDSVSADPGDPATVTAERKSETALLKAHGSVASRNGDVLTIRGNGRDLARFTDKTNLYCHGDSTCVIWTFSGMASLNDGHGHKADYPTVTQFSGEIYATAVIDVNGRLIWLSSAPTVSPDGRFLATQSDENLGDGVLHITDWLSPGHSAGISFEGQICEPVKWLSATSLQAKCRPKDSQSEQMFAATASFDGKAWHLAVVTKPATKARKKVKAHPAVVTTVDGKAGAVLAPQQRADADASDRADGYERLATPDGP